MYGGYSDMGGGGGGVIAVAIHGWSGYCQSNSGVQGYSDIAMDGPGTVSVTPVYGDTLT